MDTTIETLDADLTLTRIELFLAREWYADLMARAILDGEAIAASVTAAALARVELLTDRVRRIADGIAYRTPSAYQRDYWFCGR